jgi:hypothetical protein
LVCPIEADFLGDRLRKGEVTPEEFAHSAALHEAVIVKTQDRDLVTSSRQK